MAVGLEALVAQFDGRKNPPLEQWNPTDISSIDIKINREGDWLYNGSKIERKRMVALFSTILWRENDTYYLKTPQQKLQIEVAVAPFIVLLMEVEGTADSQCLHFTDNTGNRFTCNADHPIYMLQNNSNEAQPCVTVRRNLPALLSRAVYYQLAELLVEQGNALGVWSDGSFFALHRN